MKKNIILGVILLLIGTAGICYRENVNSQTMYEYTTKPLYVNNQLSVTEHPLLEKDGVLHVPVKACSEYLEHDNIDSDDLLNIKDGEYVSVLYLQNELNWNVYDYETAIYIDNFSHKFDYSWTTQPYVAHAFGAIGDDTYTNSLEAFKENYNLGHRVFEVDFTMTSDHKLVALHDWTEYNITTVCEFDIPPDKIGTALTAEEFLDLKVKGKYTTLAFEDILQLLKEYPDIYIITDTKETTVPLISKQFQYMVSSAEKIDLSLLDRIIPQIYNEDMFNTIMEIYDWKSIVYTLYNQGMGFSPQEVIDFSYRNGIRAITTYTARAHDLFINELLKRNCIIYMHTYNTMEELAYWKEKGVSGFYTDFLIPE